MTKDKVKSKEEIMLEGLGKLREPFLGDDIGKLPKPAKWMTDAVRADKNKGINCKICGGWHHRHAVHLDYVGHAALTKRLLDVDPLWNWEPLATNEDGNPVLDLHGGMWINLTVCGITRKGYGDADGKKGGAAMKEVIGDALRNAGMRFGMALDLWHKGDFFMEDTEPEEGNATVDKQKTNVEDLAAMGAKFKQAIEAATSVDHLNSIKSSDSWKEWHNRANPAWLQKTDKHTPLAMLLEDKIKKLSVESVDEIPFD